MNASRKEIKRTVTTEIRPNIEMLRDLLAQRLWLEARELLQDAPAPDIADFLIEVDNQDRILLFRLLPRPTASEVFSYLEPQKKDDLLSNLSDKEARRLLAGLSPDDRTDFFEELPGQATQRLLNLLSLEDRREALQLLGYPEESVGRLMTPDYVAVRPDWTVGQAIEHIRRRGRDSETINVIYVVDPSWKLLDALELRRFILAQSGVNVEAIMDYAFVSISGHEDREKAVDLIQRYDLDALPVVDSEGVLVGIVTVDDVMDVAQEEATEDFHLVGGVIPLKSSYREVGLWSLFIKRIGWLTGLILVNIAAAEIIAFHEELLLSSIALAFFIPLLIATGGNTGAQSATMMIRAIATGDLRPDHWLWAAARESLLGIILGLSLGILVWFLGYYRGGLRMGIVVFLSMAGIVLVSNLIGAGLPFLLNKLRVDPAVASSPLITSVADVAGLSIYFSIAAWLLGI
jgi:magnesium transporter